MLDKLSSALFPSIASHTHPFPFPAPRPHPAARAMYQTVHCTAVDTPYISPAPVEPPIEVQHNRTIKNTNTALHTYLADRNYSVITTSMAHGSKTEISCQKRKKKRDSLSPIFPLSIRLPCGAPFSPLFSIPCLHPFPSPLVIILFPKRTPTCNVVAYNGYFGLPNGQSPFREIALQLRQPPPMHAVITSCTVHMFI